MAPWLGSLVGHKEAMQLRMFKPSFHNQDFLLSFATHCAAIFINSLSQQRVCRRFEDFMGSVLAAKVEEVRKGDSYVLLFLSRFPHCKIPSGRAIRGSLHFDKTWLPFRDWSDTQPSTNEHTIMFHDRCSY
eukprot:jgi/Bigna1/131228/aug1.13_g5936